MNSLLMKVPIFYRLFGPKEDSRNAARDRLKKALVGDRKTVAPQLMNCLQRDIEECTAKYLRADNDHSVYKIVNKDGKMTLKVEIPILQINRQRQLPKEALKEESHDESIELKLSGKKLRKRRRRKKSPPTTD
jgi:cell division topological specificity factor MinE